MSQNSAIEWTEATRFSVAERVRFGAHRAAPRDANRRGHGTEGEASMQAERTAKRCARCGDDKPLGEFGIDRSRPDGRKYWCRVCWNTRSRQSYVPQANGITPGPARAPARDGDKAQTRRRVNVHVRTGRWPHPNALPCADCGHEWAEGGRRHEYDHHLGYAAEHHESVESVCTMCHHEREARRG